MAAKTFGVAHLYGVVGRITNATVLSFNNDESFLQEDTTIDEDGRKIEDRMDDISNDATIVIRMRATYVKPDIGTLLTYDSILYIIRSISHSEEAKGYRTLTLKISNSEYVALA